MSTHVQIVSQPLRNWSIECLETIETATVTWHSTKVLGHDTVIYWPLQPILTLLHLKKERWGPNNNNNQKRNWVSIFHVTFQNCKWQIDCWTFFKAGLILIWRGNPLALLIENKSRQQIWLMTFRSFSMKRLNKAAIIDNMWRQEIN